MFAFEGEWYSGVDRLHHLERRVGGPECVPLFAPPELIFGTAGEQRRTVIDFYCSLRSPYTYLACERLAQLATHYRASVRLRFLLPMVKRGVPLSRAKRLYIVRDAAREARRLGLPFGDIADPLGAPAERGLALLHHAIQQNRGAAFLASFLRGVFAEGIDAGSAAGLRNLARRAGIKTCEIDAALANLAWRDEAEHNRQALEAQGLWGVPSFAVEGRAALWGQDRLWMLEEDLRGDPRGDPQ
jgi:2-hydroxychromene-2-carboxylate isomerase